MAAVLRRGMNIDAMSAEDDSVFLDNCLVQTADMVQIRNMAAPQCIALGRTGSGKSAILINLERHTSNVIRISPEALSLNYISNSDILRFFENLDIKLDVFYQLLWRHVLAVELIKAKKRLTESTSGTGILATLFSRFNPNQKKRQALEYLFRFGDTFWIDTEKRVREVVNNIEKSFEDQVGFTVSAFQSKLAADLKEKNLDSVKQSTDIIHRAQKVVNSVQIQELNSVMDFLAEDVFKDDQGHYYIVVDDLDTGWVHDGLRFKLVRALIETTKKFRRVPNLKIILGLRADLMETVLAKTVSAGFQTEKYEDMLLRLRWNKTELRELADKRIAYLFKDQYTNRSAGFYDLFPLKIGTQETFDYLIDRTLYRPRDLISFINECLVTADGSGQISQRSVRSAEAPYSKKRLRSLADEWREAYGDLEQPLDVLRGLKARFVIRDITDNMLEGLCINLVAGDQMANPGVFSRECELVTRGQFTYSRVRQVFIEILYVIGAIGLKLRKGAPYEWSYRNEPLLDYNALNDESSFAIHPMLFRELNIRADPTTLV